MTTFSLATLRSVQQDDPSIVCGPELRADRDPGEPVRPGERIECEWILTPQGRALVLPPGHRGVLKDLTDGLGEDVRLVGVGPAGYGLTGVEPDGTVTYDPFRDHLGYDWFDYVLEAGPGHLATGRVTVHVGEPGTPRGVLRQQGTPGV